MRAVGIVLDHDRNPLDDRDPQRRRVFALHPGTRHAADGRDPLGDGVGVDLQQRRAWRHRGGLLDLVLGDRGQAR